MCHLILFLPVLVLPVFWVLPPAISIPTYLVVIALSGGMYYLAARAYCLPAICGADSLIHQRGQVMDFPGDTRVRIGQEIWRAGSAVPLSSGIEVEVVGRDEFTLLVRPLARTEPIKGRSAAPAVNAGGRIQSAPLLRRNDDGGKRVPGGIKVR